MTRSHTYQIICHVECGEHSKTIKTVTRKPHEYPIIISKYVYNMFVQQIKVRGYIDHLNVNLHLAHSQRVECFVGETSKERRRRECRKIHEISLSCCVEWRHSRVKMRKGNWPWLRPLVGKCRNRVNRGPI